MKRPSSSLRLGCLATLLGGLFLAAPGSALAHGLNVDDDPNRPLYQYVWLGFQHMSLGWDHLLFIIGCVLLAPTVKIAAELVSLFVLGHSLTLLIATLAGWKVSIVAVDVAIALSVVFVGALGVWRGQRNWRLIGAVVFAFGLIHGLGLSTRLQEIALPDDGLAIRIILFNVGIELGQLTVMLVVVGLWRLLGRALRNPAVARRYAFGAMVAVGVLAAAILPFTAEPEDAAAKRASCRESQTTPPKATQDGGHPPKRFYLADEQAPAEDVAHVIYDGWIVVTYNAALPPARRTELQEWVEGKDQAVLAVPGEDQAAALQASTVRSRLTCTKFDLPALISFRDTWFGTR